MPEVDLSNIVPPHATWIKIRYTITPLKPGANLIARVWSGVLDDAVVLKEESGEVALRLDKPQSISYQNPVNVELKLKIVAYKTTDQ